MCTAAAAFARPAVAARVRFGSSFEPRVWGAGLVHKRFCDCSQAPSSPALGGRSPSQPAMGGARRLAHRLPSHALGSLPICCPPLSQPARRSTVVVRAAAGWDPSAEVPAHLKDRTDLAGSECGAVGGGVEDGVGVVEGREGSRVEGSRAGQGAASIPRQRGGQCRRPPPAALLSAAPPAGLNAPPPPPVLQTTVSTP